MRSIFTVTRLTDPLKKHFSKEGRKKMKKVKTDKIKQRQDVIKKFRAKKRKK